MVGNTLVPHPDLVHLSSRNVDPRTNTEGLLDGTFIFWVCNGQGAAADQVRCETRVRVWQIMCIRSIGPSENVRESPASHRSLVIRAWLLWRCHCYVVLSGRFLNIYRLDKISWMALDHIVAWECRYVWGRCT